MGSGCARWFLAMLRLRLFDQLGQQVSLSDDAYDDAFLQHRQAIFFSTMMQAASSIVMSGSTVMTCLALIITSLRVSPDR